MSQQDRAAMTAEAFVQWRRAMGWEVPQAAHVLLKSKQSIVAWEAGTTPIDDRTAFLCESCQVVRFLNSPLAFGNVHGTVLPHHAELVKRMQEADAMEVRGRGRPRAITSEDALTGFSDDQLKAAGVLPRDAHSAGTFRTTPPSRK